MFGLSVYVSVSITSHCYSVSLIIIGRELSMLTTAIFGQSALIALMTT